MGHSRRHAGFRRLAVAARHRTHHRSASGGDLPAHRHHFPNHGGHQGRAGGGGGAGTGRGGVRQPPRPRPGGGCAGGAGGLPGRLPGNLQRRSGLPIRPSHLRNPGALLRDVLRGGGRELSPVHARLPPTYRVAAGHLRHSGGRGQNHQAGPAPARRPPGQRRPGGTVPESAATAGWGRTARDQDFCQRRPERISDR